MPASSQQFLCPLRVILIGVYQLVIAIAQCGGQDREAGSVQPANGLGGADGIIVNAHENGLPEGLVAQNTVQVHPAETAAYTGGNVHRVIGVLLEVLDVRNIGDVLHQVHLAALQCHGLGRGIAHKENMDLVIGHFFPIVGVGFHIVTHTHAVEFVNHIGTGTDGTVVKILCMLHIQDRHHRIGQLARANWHRAWRSRW